MTVALSDFNRMGDLAGLQALCGPTPTPWALFPDSLVRVSSLGPTTDGLLRLPQFADSLPSEMITVCFQILTRS